MTTEAYIRDKRFAALCAAFRYPDGDVEAYHPHVIANEIKDVDWSKTALLCHHGQFEALILSHHYGIRPAAIIDTMAMARLMYPSSRVGLGHLAGFLLGPEEAKTVPYASFKGKQWAELNYDEQSSLLAGNIQDVRLTWAIFQKLIAGFPVEELAVIDMTIRMFSEPRLAGDIAKFKKIAADEWTRKNDALQDLNVTTEELQSATKFSALLQAEGVEPKFKSGKNGPIPAFAKSDEFMQGLLDHENPRVQALAECRLDVKSTIDETRAGRFAASASRGSMPVYLNYCGAMTTRWSGGDKMNFQNMPRPEKDNPLCLRKGLRAPKGHLLAVVDKAQIEFRYAMALAGQTDVLEQLSLNVDVYCGFASAYYGRTITEADEDERMFGKVVQLAAQYGMGASKFQKVAKCDLKTAETAIATYRRVRNRVPLLWKTLDSLLPILAAGLKGSFTGPISIDKGQIILPNQKIPNLP